MEEDNIYLEVLKNINIDTINEEDRELIKLKFWILLGKRIERYTMGDSSSVPVEIAEELLKSICFSLRRELDNANDRVELLVNDELESLLEESWKGIEEDIDAGKKLLDKVIKEDTGIENTSYLDTIMEIAIGFNKYDYRFLAHEINCSIDYQLSNPVSEKLQGIEYINEYLKRLLFENRFCKRFEKEKTEKILNSYCKDYKEALINIFEPLITNVIGLEILEDDIFKLEITSSERNIMLYIFKNISIEELVLESVNKICNKLKIIDVYEIDYVKKTALNLVPRIEEGVMNNNLDNIFLSFKIEEKLNKNSFIDNVNMDDEKLRDVIEEVKSCRFAKDKLIIIRNEVHSLDDFIEILNNCIWEEDMEELFNDFTDDEKMLLKYYLDNNLNNNVSNTGWENKFKEL